MADAHPHSESPEEFKKHLGKYYAVLDRKSVV